MDNERRPLNRGLVNLLNIQDDSVTPEQKNIAIHLLQLDEELERLELEKSNLRRQLLEKMQDSGILAIKTRFGQFQIVTKRNIKVNKKKAEIYLDSIGDKEAFMKLDETKVKKTFHNEDSNTSYDFIEVQEPTQYLKFDKRV